MNTSTLQTYLEIEREKGEKIANTLLDDKDVIKDARALYPEYQLKKPFGLHRPGVNLGSLLFFYRQVVAYVPPMSRSQFVHRFGIGYESFMALAFPSDPADRFIFPVLNHPRRYRRALFRTELSELLIQMPPTWERWHSALALTGGDRWFDQSDDRFNYKAIWSIQDYRDDWRQKLRTTSEAFVSKEIKQQVRNNYTDLCLIGMESLANEIADLSHEDPLLAINELLYSSDLFAYPSVMGAGGKANVRAKTRATVGYFDIKKAQKVFPDGKHFDSNVLETLFEGLRFDAIPNVFRLQFLQAWHTSNNAILAREAYSTILDIAQERNPSLEELHETVKVILDQLQEFCRNAEPSDQEVSQMASTKNTSIVRISAAGGIIATLVGLFTMDVIMAIAGGVFTIVGARTWQNKEKIVKRLLQRHAPEIPESLYKKYKLLDKSAEQMWRDIVREHGSSSGSPKKSATSVPVRAIWWSEPD